MTTKCSQLKMTAADGKKYKTDCADTEQLFRLIQSIGAKDGVMLKSGEDG